MVSDPLLICVPNLSNHSHFLFAYLLRGIRSYFGDPCYIRCRLTLPVPKPRPGVFRSTKDMHNILQGVNKPDKRLTQDEQDEITDWITHNAKTYWLSSGGPLRPAEEGGAHIIVVGWQHYPAPIDI